MTRDRCELGVPWSHGLRGEPEMATPVSFSVRIRRGSGDPLSSWIHFLSAKKKKKNKKEEVCQGTVGPFTSDGVEVSTFRGGSPTVGQEPHSRSCAPKPQPLAAPWPWPMYPSSVSHWPLDYKMAEGHATLQELLGWFHDNKSRGPPPSPKSTVIIKGHCRC